MGLFSTKFCDICGEKIGLLGNRKLEDGNLCKDCANKLSPFFSERRKSTIEDIKSQLAYREENKAAVAAFRPSRTLGTVKKVYIDDNAGKFIISSSAKWQNENPDVIDLSQVTNCRLDVQENRKELKWRDKEGKEFSYNPPRYKFEYDFAVIINVNSPWFDEIIVGLNNRAIAVESALNQFSMYGGQQQDIGRSSAEYRECEGMGEMIIMALMQRGQYVPGNYGAPAYPQQQPFYGQQQPVQGNYPQPPYGQQPPMQGNYPQQPYGQPPMQGNYPQPPYGQQPPMQGNYGVPGYPPQQTQPIVCPLCKATTVPDVQGRCPYCGGRII